MWIFWGKQDDYRQNFLLHTQKSKLQFYTFYTFALGSLSTHLYLYIFHYITFFIIYILFDHYLHYRYPNVDHMQYLPTGADFGTFILIFNNIL